MALSPSRIFAGGETDYPWERGAVDFVLAELPDTDPHLAWPLHELLDPGSGRLYEIDLMVLARSGLFLIEIKSHPGVLTGDSRDWTFTEQGGRQRHLACPHPSANHKAKVLANLLGLKMRGLRPYVQPLVFVSDPNTDIRLSGGAPPYLVTQKDIRKVLVNGLGGSRRAVVNRPMMREVTQAMRGLGLRPSKQSRMVGGFQLKRLVDEREGYQEHHGVSNAVKGDSARVRSYLVPKATTTERRDQLRRAAQREAQLLARLRHHPSILSYRAYEPDGPLGPAVIFESFERGLPLNLLLKQEPDLSFNERLGVLQQMVEAVDHCHRAELLHRNLSPNSVLVRRVGEKLEIRIHRFQTAAQSNHTSIGTHHLSQHAEALDRIYQAPEVLRDPRKASPGSDVFSLGCLAWLLFTGQDPASDLAERERLINAHEGLRIATINSELANLDEVIAFATHPLEIARADDAMEWFETYLLEVLTKPPLPDEAQRDPYEAAKDETLLHGLTVVRLLGSGATAKVLKVRKEGRDYALKVPHDAGCTTRLLEEGAVLERLNHEHIIGLRGILEFPNRTCLLLDYAGVGEGDKRHSSFADLLRAEGTLSLEKARRYGAGLLAAVQYLEEQGVTHRDIKPSNMGFTTQAKKARHLALYDFSLSAGSVESVQTGTPEWRDPWVHVRGRWDAHADRYAAACVLYRMLAGTRPQVAESGIDAGQVRVEAERFDPAIRDRLKDYFRRCFAENVADRYDQTETMRTDWLALFAQPAIAGPSEESVNSDDLGKARLNTLVESLPFSARAKNALDRAGVVIVEHLLQLPRNHLSAIRGVGHQVAKEIVEIATLLGERLDAATAPVLVPNYAGPQIGLDAEVLAIGQDWVDKLHDAGVTSTRDAAEMPLEWVTRLLGEAGASRVREELEGLAEAYAPEGTLSEWVKALLAPQRKRKTAAERRIRALVGLDPLPGSGTEDASTRGGRSVVEVAEAFQIDPALIYSSIQAMRRRWAESPCVEELAAALIEVINARGPACTMEELAAALVQNHGIGDLQDPEQQTVALGLVRLACELRPPICHWRAIGGTAWVAEELLILDTLAVLAQEADGIARLEPLASSETVISMLTAKAAGTSLAGVASDRLVHLSSRASESAAASARMEIYPEGMSASRALKLSLNVLTPPGLTEEVVRQRVRARYPAAEVLPERPELDAVLAAHQLRYEAELGEYVRPGLAHQTVSSTIMAPSRHTSAQTHQRRRMSPEAQEAKAFQDALDRGVESGRFRAVQVRADFAQKAAQLLADTLGVAPVSLDHAIWERMQVLAGELGITDLSLLINADRAGSDAPEWGHLLELAKQASKTEVDALLADREQPRLLINPGIFARFGLQQTLVQLVRRSQHEDGAAVVLVIPSHADGLAPTINNQLAVPTEAGGQRLRMPESWLANEHRAAARKSS